MGSTYIQLICALILLNKRLLQNYWKTYVGLNKMPAAVDPMCAEVTVGKYFGSFF